MGTITAFSWIIALIWCVYFMWLYLDVSENKRDDYFVSVFLGGMMLLFISIISTIVASGIHWDFYGNTNFDIPLLMFCGLSNLAITSIIGIVIVNKRGGVELEELNIKLGKTAAIIVFVVSLLVSILGILGFYLIQIL